MNVGDLVKIHLKPSRGHRRPRENSPHGENHHAVGVIVDVLENEDGWCNFEVAFDGGCEWFSDLELEVITAQSHKKPT
jgi:hypothetical protein